MCWKRKARAGIGVERPPVGEGGLQQGMVPPTLVSMKGAAPSIDDRVALGRQVQHGVGPEAPQDVGDRRAVADIDLKCCGVAAARLGQRFGLPA